uniref:phosphohydrolase n=1 Tax=Capnocytophaga leadbetteri TaxID=327575 RepID=UPI0028D50B6E|nr:phosphohydrolase [Capnocytophaga leadbetteri]
MELQVGKSYRVKNDIFNFKAGEVWSLVREGYQAYYGEQNFVFVNAEKSYRYIVLRNSSDEDMEIGCHLDRYFEEIE